MSTNYDKYFPERFVKNRPFVNKAIKAFINSDFYNYAAAYHDLREFIRQPVAEWQKGASLPDYLIEEGDDILSRLHKDDIHLSDKPTKEELQEYAKNHIKKMQTEVWKEWSNWHSKTKGLIKNHPRLEEETETTKSIIEFFKNGRNIFSLSPFLIHLLNHTDIGNIRFSDLKLPYNCIYLHFGALPDIEYPIDLFEHKHNIENELQNEHRKYYLDGAFVTLLHERSLDIRLTFIDTKDSFDRKALITSDFRFPTIGFTLDFSNWDNEESKLKLDNEVTFNHSTICFYDIWDPKTVPSEIEFNKMHSLTEHPEKCFESELEEYILFDKSLMIIVNALCYLNFVDDDVEISTTNEQATQLEKELSQTKKRQTRNNLTDKLKKFSYSKIHFCGNRIENEFKITGTGIEVEPHWRRGHWRNQPFGVGLTNRKLIWIKPTIVRKDKGEPNIGHIYDV
jgi:hypothetical protein